MNLLKKIAQLADEADLAGHTDMADQLDRILIEAAYNPLDEELDQKAVQDASAAEAAKQEQAKKAHNAKQHEAVVAAMRALEADLKANGKNLFTLPAGQVSADQLKAALKTIGVVNYKTWGELLGQVKGYHLTKMPLTPRLDNSAQSIPTPKVEVAPASVGRTGPAVAPK